MFEAIIFDFDGTLADTGHIMQDVLQVLCRKYGLPEPDQAQIEKLRGRSLMERLRYFNMPLHRLPLLTQEALSLYSKQIGTASPFPGVRSLLAELDHLNINRAILSSNSAATIRLFLDGHDLNGFSMIKGHAPIFDKHRTLHRMLRKLDTDRQKILYVGDELRDIEACRKISLPVAAVSWGYDHRALLADGQPDYLIDRPDQLRELLTRRH
ncbi:MAG: HAD-IA family hydrolase [Ruminococcaceae bacterium]|jgi:phosphoglycolate phosphatase|nr:HAD-IA family hydrolase [Oscillospiraceae bacterium]